MSAGGGLPPDSVDVIDGGHEWAPGQRFGRIFWIRTSHENERLRPRRWSPSPLLYASAAVHLGAAAALTRAAAPGPGRWAPSWRTTSVLAAAGLWPRSQLLGANWTRLAGRAALSAGVAITIDDGPDPDVTPQVLAQLDEARGARDFFLRGRTRAAPCGPGAGNRAPRPCDRESQPAASAQFFVVGSGRHERGNFARAGQHFAGDRQQSAIFSRAGGTAQSLSRPGTGPAAAAPGQLDAARLRYRQARMPMPCTGAWRIRCEAGDILLLHDGNAARTRRGTPVILDVLPRVLDAWPRGTAARHAALGASAMNAA